jgi:enoyl-[acyl-carrier protein] reductase I
MTQQLLHGKKGIIFGALDEHSLAWQAALKIKEYGGTFVLTNTPVALRLGTVHQLAEICQTQVVSADATVVEDLENLFDEAQDGLGGKIDFILHSIGMSPNV